MTFPDLIGNAGGNLWRMKLRASLTVSGVVIAIAAFVSMLSFGAGMQQNVSTQFNDLGLFSTLQVYPQGGNRDDDSAKAAVLNAATVTMLSSIPGVNLAYPFDAFTVTAAVGDTQVTTRAQALSAAAIKTKLFSQLVAGSAPTPGNDDEALVTEELVHDLNLRDPDSLVGRELIVSAKLSNIDSAITHVLSDPFGNWRERLASVRIDSLQYAPYRKHLIYRELGRLAGQFTDGLFNAKAVVHDTLIITGVIQGRQGGRSRRGPIIVPVATALRIKSAGFSADPADLLSMIRDGALIATQGDLSGETYPRVTLDLDPTASYDRVKDSVEALGYRTFSYVDQFQEIRRFFFYFNIALGIVGMIALVTASLGIVNTMVMSILERTREIGILKSLGADDRDIRSLFLTESGMIGTIGAAMGIVTGWIITRIASFVAQIVMERQGFPEMEMFALPWWLITIALVFGLLVSLVAGLYPALRAARVDPVQALRNE